MKRTFALALAALALIVAGCGDDEESGDKGADTGGGAAAPAPETTEKGGGGGAGATSELQVAADPSGQLKFDKASLSAPSGKVTITMDNPSDVPHAVGIEGNGVDEDGKTVQKGGVSTVSADLKPGKYEFYCPVAGHAEAGMKGPLTIK
jgi:plastocyanin